MVCESMVNTIPEPWRTIRESPSGIYCFQDADRPLCKIGWSCDIIKRFKEARTWAPRLVWIADTFWFGSPEEERETHAILRAQRLGCSEWFTLDKTVAFHLWLVFGIRWWTHELIKALWVAVRSDPLPMGVGFSSPYSASQDRAFLYHALTSGTNGRT